MQQTRKIDSQKLHQFIEELFTAEGVDSSEASIITNIFIWFDLIGRYYQGVARLPHYLERFRQNLIKSPCHPEFTQKAETIYLVDGHDGFGHYLGHISMMKAIEVAKQYGVGIVGVTHSNHFGAGAYYVQLAAQHAQLGLALSNSFPKVAPYGGVSAVLGTNPFAFGAPMRNGQSVLVDFSTGASAGSAVTKMIESNQPIPEGILIDRMGNTIVDPQKASQAVMLPFGGAKGYCLGLMVEILSGVLTGAGISHEIASMYKNWDRSAKIGHFFMAIDIAKLMTIEEYYERIEQLVTFVKAAQPMPGVKEILMPGEARWQNYFQQLEEGICLAPTAVEALNALAKRFKLVNTL